MHLPMKTKEMHGPFAVAGTNVQQYSGIFRHAWPPTS